MTKQENAVEVANVSAAIVRRLTAYWRSCAELTENLGRRNALRICADELDAELDRARERQAADAPEGR